MNVENPLCPKCGCPARVIVGVFTVRVSVTSDKDGSLSKTGEKRVGKPVEGFPLTLECGGRHRWTTKEIAA